MLVWEEDQETEVWINSARLGQLFGNKNHFYGVKTSHNGLNNTISILAYTYTGAIYFYEAKIKTENALGKRFISD